MAHQFFKQVEREENIGLGTAYWVKYVRYRIDNHKNFLGCCIGPTGSGKSYSMLSLADKLSPNGLKIENVCFKATTFLERLNSGELKPGDVLLWDESGVDLNAKKWQSLTNRVINLVVQTFRHERLIILFTVPYFSFMDSDTRKLIHGLFKTRRIDRKNNLNIVSPYLIQVNEESGKMYKKYLRVKHGGGRLTPIKKVTLNRLPDDFMNQYESISSTFKVQVRQDALLALQRIEEEKKYKKKSGELTEKQREAVKMYEDGLTMEEIANKLGIKTPAVYQRLNLAEKKIEINKKPIGNAVLMINKSYAPNNNPNLVMNQDVN